MEVRIRHRKGNQTEAFARFHRIVCDQPFDDGGTDRGMTPPELMLSSLGCCAMHYAAEYLSARGLPVEGTELTVSAKKGGRPVRLTDIGIVVDAPQLTNHMRQGLIHAVEACLLHRTLRHPPTLKITAAAAANARPAGLPS
jgi:uncharacterized OsmC-like protein